MSDIDLVRRHSLSIADAKDLVQKAADSLAREYHLCSEWRGDTLRFERPGVHGAIHVTDSEVRLAVTLGLLLKAFKASFTAHIERNLDKYLPEPQSGAKAKEDARKTARARK
jgi:putative polyhydroxyalkanoate system protein